MQSIPTLDILNTDGNLDEYAIFTVHAVMLYPENVIVREEFLETLHVQVASQLLYEEAKENGLPESVPLHEHTNIWIQKQAGPLLDNTAENAWAASVAGDVLLWYVQIHTHCPPASINKAMEIAEQYLSNATDSFGEHGPRSLREIKTAWASYKSVAHLWAAFRVIQFRAGNTAARDILAHFLLMYDSLPSFLAMAAWFRQAGTTLRSQGQRTPILDPHKTWCTPPQLPLPPVNVTPPPLEDWAAEVLKQYRAPKRF